MTIFKVIEKIAERVEKLELWIKENERDAVIGTVPESFRGKLELAVNLSKNEVAFLRSIVEDLADYELLRNTTITVNVMEPKTKVPSLEQMLREQLEKFMQEAKW